ncbi:MAG: hypothetical protein MI723_07765 [Caulobacterales bacterium]|nr:hypothetical protein [Caulobacterales bacterium]
MTALLCGGGAYAEPERRADSSWFYMVKTKSTDPERVDDFNAWYDDIDLPDVLEVASFRRARRGILEEVAGIADLRPSADEGDYVALYDITADDIDTAIIDLYVAARRMTARGRITDLLKVMEANYYRLQSSQAGSGPAPGDDASTYFLLQKALCCHSVAERARFLSWFTDDYAPAIAGERGVAEVRLFDLYRIMEVEAVPPTEVPHFLIVHEVRAPGDGADLADVARAARALQGAGEPLDFVEGDDSAFYRLITDMRSVADP